MAKKKKKKKGNAPNAQAPESFSFNPFAGKLGGLKAAKAKASAKQRQEAEKKQRQVQASVQAADREQRVVVGRAEALRGEPVEMTAEELFAKAVSDLDPKAIHKGKFLGHGPDTQHVRLKEERRPSPKEIAELDEPDDPFHNAVATFEEVMDLQGIVPIESKTHVPDKGVDLNAERLYRFEQTDYSKDPAAIREEALDMLLAAEGPVLSPSQRKVLQAYRKAYNTGATVPEVNVRGETRPLALRQLELAVLQAGVRGDRFLRVITGKGLLSAGEPVLKRAVAEWCFGDGADLVVDYAPELLPDGTFGCIIVCVRRRRRR